MFLNIWCLLLGCGAPRPECQATVSELGQPDPEHPVPVNVIRLPAPVAWPRRIGGKRHPAGPMVGGRTVALVPLSGAAWGSGTHGWPEPSCHAGRSPCPSEAVSPTAPHPPPAPARDEPCLDGRKLSLGPHLPSPMGPAGTPRRACAARVFPEDEDEEPALLFPRSEESFFCGAAPSTFSTSVIPARTLALSVAP